MTCSTPFIKGWIPLINDPRNAPPVWQPIFGRGQKANASSEGPAAIGFRIDRAATNDGAPDDRGTAARKVRTVRRKVAPHGGSRPDPGAAAQFSSSGVVLLVSAAVMESDDSARRHKFRRGLRSASQ